MRYFKLTHTSLFIALVLLIISNCKKEFEEPETPNEPEVPADTVKKPIEISIEPGKSKNLWIQSDLQSEIEIESSTGIKYNLSIPKGATFQIDSIEIIITPIISVNNLPKEIELIAGLHFEPDGFAFLKPAILTIELTDPVNLDSLWVFSYQGYGDDFHLISHIHQDTLQTISQSISIPVSHFSGTIVGLGEFTDCANIGYPTDPQSLYEQGITCILDDAAKNNRLIDWDNPEDYYHGRIKSALLAWFYELVLPNVKGAGSLDEARDNIMKYFIRWTGSASLITDVIADTWNIEIDLISKAINDIIWNDFKESDSLCILESDPCKKLEYLAKWAEWESLNQAFFGFLGIPIIFPGDYDDLCGGELLGITSNVKIKNIKNPVYINEEHTFWVSIKNYQGMDILEFDGDVWWWAQNISQTQQNKDIGTFVDPANPTFRGLNKGEVEIIANVIPPDGCATDAIIIMVEPDCDKEPLSDGCSTEWEGTAQFSETRKMVFFGARSNSCSGGWGTINVKTYDLKIVLDFEQGILQPIDNSQEVGTVYWTGKLTVERTGYVYSQDKCQTTVTEIDINESDRIYATSFNEFYTDQEGAISANLGAYFMGHIDESGCTLTIPIQDEERGGENIVIIDEVVVTFTRID